jgi:hypothetical protein
MRFLLFLLWIAFIGYAYFFAPGERGMDDAIMQSLLRFQSDEPSLLAVFSLLGVFPIAFGCLLLRADRYSVPAWPFVLASLALGAFALLPYFFLTSPTPRRNNRTPTRLFYILIHGMFLFILLVLAIWIIVYGVVFGDWNAYLEAFQQSHLVHVMTIDLIILCILSMIAIKRDRVYAYPAKIIPIIGCIPAVGLLIYTLAFAARPHRG